MEDVKFQKYVGKMPTSDFEIAGFQKPALGYSKHAKPKCLSVTIFILLIKMHAYMVVYCAAQEASPEYINRKTKNVIITPI